MFQKSKQQLQVTCSTVQLQEQQSSAETILVNGHVHCGAR